MQAARPDATAQNAYQDPQGQAATPTVAKAMSPQLIAALRQGQILAAMGIGRWVSQYSQPVQVSPNAWQAEVLTAPPAVLPNPAQLDQPVLSKSASPSPVPATGRIPVSQTVPSTDNRLGFEPVEPLPMANPAAANDPIVPPLVQATPIAANDALVLKRFAIEAITVYDWVILADQQVLQGDAEQAQLWHNLTRNLRRPIHLYRYPLHDEPEPLTEAQSAILNSSTNILASFGGFLYGLTSLEQGQQTGQAYQLGMGYRLGTVTPLSLLNENVINVLGLSVETLPSLQAMLHEPALKRQLWHTLSQSASS